MATSETPWNLSSGMTTSGSENCTKKSLCYNMHYYIGSCFFHPDMTNCSKCSLVKLKKFSGIYEFQDHNNRSETLKKCLYVRIFSCNPLHIPKVYWKGIYGNVEKTFIFYEYFRDNPLHTPKINCKVIKTYVERTFICTNIFVIPPHTYQKPLANAYSNNSWIKDFLRR